MRASSRFIPPLILSLALAGGCATERNKTPRATTEPSPEAVAEKIPETDPRRMALDEIQPKPVFAKAATTNPTTQTQRAPLEAIELYAQAIDSLKTGRRFSAINLLEKAVGADPQSFELNFALGKAYVMGRADDERSIASLERAAAIEPDHLELQTALGRQYLTRSAPAKALEHLRLAAQTKEYVADESGSAEADLFLGRALQQNGYDRAALEQYAKLLKRVSSRTSIMRSDPRLAFLITDRLYVDIGDLYFRNGQFDDALAAFEPAAKRDPSDFELEARVVRALAGLKRFDDASRRAADAVVRFRASPQSLALLEEVQKSSGRPGGAADELARMLKQRPNDTAILFALVELLRSGGKWAEAESVLADQSARTPDDSTIVRRRLGLRLQQNDNAGAARLLIETLASRPDVGVELNDLWTEIISPARPGHVKLSDIQSLAVPPAQTAAKEMSVAAVASSMRRESFAQQAVERAVQVTPPFAPAFRERLVRIWQSRTTGDDAERARRAEQLIASVATGDPILAQELTGLSLLYQKKNKDAALALAKAVDAGGKSSSLQLSHASALRAVGDNVKFEQLMWRIVSDHPNFEPAYSTLYGHYAQAGSEAQSDRVLRAWLLAAPYSVSARVIEAARHFGAGRTDVGEQVFSRLLEDHGDDDDVLRSAHVLYSRAGKSSALLSIVEQRVKNQPGNVAALVVLTELYAAKEREADAVSAIDAARRTLSDDPDQLYRIASLYLRVNRKEANEAVLRRVLEIEPTHPPASNDLGYNWADRGENLDSAETLVRQAVAAEPENASFLDSLGWVLYKRGRFAESRLNLEKAAGGAGEDSQADPIVLDHLGDVLYRLGEKDAAAKQWEQAGAKLKSSEEDSPREELKQLKTSLDRKAKQLKANEPVTVSPVVEEARQAKN